MNEENRKEQTLYEDAAQLRGDEAEERDVGDVGGDGEEVDHDEVRDG